MAYTRPYLLAGSIAAIIAVVSASNYVDLTRSQVLRSPNNSKPKCLSKEKIVFTKAEPGQLGTAEIYMMNPDGSEATRLTNDTFADALPSLSPDGKGTIVFDSNRAAVAAGAGPINSDLFMLKAESPGGSPTFLTRGSSANWSPDGKRIAFHRSSSDSYGTRIPGRTEPGAPTKDSDIFVANIDDLIRKDKKPINITANFEGQTPGSRSADDDADWSTDGKRIAFTSRNAECNTVAECQASAEIWVMDADGRHAKRLTSNREEERSPDWSRDGKKIMFMCRVATGKPLEICVMNADGSNREVLTDNNLPDLSPSWSPDGTRIAFLRGVGGQQQIYVMNYVANANGERNDTPLTSLPTINLFPNWGIIGCRK